MKIKIKEITKENADEVFSLALQLSKVIPVKIGKVDIQDLNCQYQENEEDLEMFEFLVLNS